MADLVAPIAGQFSISDRGGNYLDRLNLMLSKLNESIGQYNSAVQAGEDAEGILTTIQQIQTDLELLEENVTVIAQGDLPAQTGKAQRAFVTDGTTGTWQHTIGCNRTASADITLTPGDRALVSCIGAVRVATLPATLVTGDPFIVANDIKSDNNLHLTLPGGAGYNLIWDAENTATPGQYKALAPGEWAELHAIDANTLKVVRKQATITEIAGLQSVLDNKLESTALTPLQEQINTLKIYALLGM